MYNLFGALFLGEDMMKIVSYVENGRDVFSLLLMTLHKERIPFKDQVLISKIRDSMQRFIRSQHPDGFKVKCAEGSIYEMRILIGGTGYLCRIFFHREKDTLILLTSFLFKPEHYSDKKTVSHTDMQYTSCIEKSHTIIQDYLTIQHYAYIFIPLPCA